MDQERKMILKLFKAMETMALINSTVERNQLIKIIMDSIKKVMEVEASSLILLDPVKNELFFHEIGGGSEEVKKIRLKVGQGIAGHVIQTKEPMIINDVKESPYFCPAVDERTTFNTKAVLCVPLISRHKVIGALEALNKEDGSPFNADDMILFKSYADQICVAIENANLYQLAIYDGLTRVFDKRYFDAWIETEFSRVKRYHTDLSLIMLDIDRFKNINDQYGHQAGDYILREIAKTVKEVIRQADILARYGGEEFIIALPETKLEKAKFTAEKIRRAIETKIFVYEGQLIKVTISLGVTSFFVCPEGEVKRFVEDADAALYQAKSEGRNKVIVFGGKKRFKRAS